MYYVADKMAIWLSFCVKNILPGAKYTHRCVKFPNFAHIFPNFAHDIFAPYEYHYSPLQYIGKAIR